MTRFRYFIGLVLFGCLVAVPPLLTDASQNIMGKMLIAGIFATGFSLLAGRTGLLSFGHAAFYGIGAIITLQLMIAVERGALAVPTPLVPLAGALAGGLLAALIGLVSTRRSGSYFTLTTLAFAELIHAVATQWHTLFGGESGLTSMRMPWAGLSFGNALEVYYCVLAWFALILALSYLLTRTAFDQVLVAIRENEERARFAGYSVLRYKVVAFTLSGAISGLAGGLLAFANESATYTLFEPYVSLQVLLHSYIGGISVFGAPAAAAALLTYLPYGLSDWTRMWPLYQGLIFMVIVICAPGGARRHADEASQSGMAFSAPLIGECTALFDVRPHRNSSGDAY